MIAIVGVVQTLDEATSQDRQYFLRDVFSNIYIAFWIIAIFGTTVVYAAIGGGLTSRVVV